MMKNILKQESNAENSKGTRSENHETKDEVASTPPIMGPAINPKEDTIIIKPM